MHPKRTVNVKIASSRGTRVFGRKNKNIRLETNDDGHGDDHGGRWKKRLGVRK